MRTFLERGVPPHIARKAEELLETRFQGRGRVAVFNPLQHPRNVLGQFADKISALAPRQRIELPDGTRVQRDPDRTFRVVRSGQIARGYTSAAAAATDALNRSARATTHPAALGSQTRFRHYTGAIGIPTTEQHEGMSNEDLARHLGKAEVDVTTARRSDDTYERRRIRPGTAAVRELQLVARRRGLSPADISRMRVQPQTNSPLDTHATPTEQNALRDYVQRYLPVGSHLAGTEIVANGVNGDYVWAQGNDGRIWSVHARPWPAVYGPNNMQVRSIGFDGTSYSAPSLEQHLSARTGIRTSSTGPSLTIDQIPGVVAHPPMNRSTTAQEAPPPPAPRRAVDHVGGRAPRIVRPTAGVRAVVSPERAQAVVDAIHGFTADGYAVRVNQATIYNFAGVVLDNDGNQVGRFSRTFEDATRVYHSSFSMDPGHQASGFGTKFINHAFAAYKRNGFRTVTVGTANIGRYQWAKMGFDFNGDHTRNNVFDAIRQIDESASIYITTDDPLKREKITLLNELVRLIDDGVITTAPQIASFGRRTVWTAETQDANGNPKPVKMWIGKWVLLQGNGWNGIRKL